MKTQCWSIRSSTGYRIFISRLQGGVLDSVIDKCPDGARHMTRLGY